MTVTLSDIAEVATAVGTVGAAGIAIYVGIVQGWLRRPVLSIERQPGSPDDVQWGSQGSNPRPGHTVAYARVRVVAKERHRAAEAAEVIVTAARAFDAQGRSRAIDIEGQSLIWSSTDPQTTVSRIPAGMPRHLDIASVQQWHPDRLFLDVLPRPSDGRHIVFEPRVDLEIAATAYDADPVRATVTIRYDGKWRAEDMGWPAGFTVTLQPR